MQAGLGRQRPDRMQGPAFDGFAEHDVAGPTVQEVLFPTVVPNHETGLTGYRDCETMVPILCWAGRIAAICAARTGTADGNGYQREPG